MEDDKQMEANSSRGSMSSVSLPNIGGGYAKAISRDEWEKKMACVMKQKEPVAPMTMSRIFARNMSKVMPSHFSMSFDETLGKHLVTSSTESRLVSLLEHYDSARVIKFVERVGEAHETIRDVAMRKHFLEAILVFENESSLVCIKPGTELERVALEFFGKHYVDVPLYAPKTANGQLFMMIHEPALADVFMWERDKKKTSLFGELDLAYEASILDGPKTWKEMGVDIGKIPNFLLLEPIQETEHTFTAEFDGFDPRSFIFRGAGVTFLEPFHCLALHKNEPVGYGPIACEKGQIHKAHRHDDKVPSLYINKHATAPHHFKFSSEKACDAHLLAFQMLRAVCARHLREKFCHKYPGSEPITFSELNAKFARKVEYARHREVLRDMVCYVIHHLRAFKEEVQDARYAELVPLTIRIVERWDNDEKSLVDDIACKKGVFDELLEVMRHLADIQKRRDRGWSSGRDDDYEDPNCLVKFFSEFSLVDKEDDQNEAERSMPELELFEDDFKEPDEPKKSTKRTAAQVPLRPDEECKKKPPVSS